MFSELCKLYSEIFNIKCRILRLFHVYGNDEQVLDFETIKLSFKK